jgi:glycosyltransferase involved in cell wall biosynthesis
MKIGYLLSGPELSGIRRYARILAGEARRQGLEVMELEGGDSAQLAGSAAAAGADVIHVQYNRRTWGGRKAGSRVARLYRKATAPIVVTIHDLYAEKVGQPDRTRILGGGADRALSAHLERATVVMVCSEQERRALEGMPNADRVMVVPHFVEPGPAPLDREKARERLGVADEFVLGVLGYIHPRKGHGLALEALKHLPERCVLWFIGDSPPGRGGFKQKLLDRAEDLDVTKRVRFAGYLEGSDLHPDLAATDLALCPFRRVAASGSLSTWISARRPILASDLPLITEYNDLVPGAIATFRPYTPEALAGAVESLMGPGGDGEAKLDRLASILALPEIWRRHLSHYEHAMARAAGAARGSL